ncbi:proteasomal ATPase-associated factor 1-like isoform X2 [Tubulanus polymorphus]|uniref:proteasomal ATPase-associated factor 1-like isoform X2 n=1 Tax=Tubulanus polymorphus TaxID=672921 RepID=UPI003DA44F53
MAAGHLILQSDWDSVLRENNGAVWITFKKPDSKSVYGDLKSHGISTNNQPYVTASDNFQVVDLGSKSITLKYDSEAESCQCKFQGPVVTFSSLHAKNKAVQCLDVTSGGLAVSCDTEGKLLVWETSSGEIRRKLEGHIADVYTCRFFPSGIVILSGGADMMLKIWCAQTGKCAATLSGHKQAITDTAIIEKGRNVISCSKDGTAKLWDCGTQSCITTFECSSGVITSSALKAPNSVVDLGTLSHQPNDREMLTEGKLLLITTENGSLQGYGVQTRSKVFDVRIDDALNCCTFVRDYDMIAGTQDGRIVAYDIRNMSHQLCSVLLGRGPVLSSLNTSQGLFITSGDGSVTCLDSQYNSVLDLTGSDCEPIYKLVFSGTHYYTACRDGCIRKYAMQNS